MPLLLQIPIQELLPEIFSIGNNNHNLGQGGGVNFGSQNFYIDDEVIKSAISVEIKELKEENVTLKEKLDSLERKLEEVLNKL